jgi:hemerythrin-like domain-containing protein
MSTVSLRHDHDLIEKVIKSMETTIQLLESGKTIPDSILLPVIDFSKNFTDVCHHTKEEKSLFPALEKSGMPTTMGPIAKMLMEHEVTRKIGNKMEISAKDYFEKGDASNLISDLKEYVEHVTEHLWKENNRLFMMAEARLQHVSQQVDDELKQIEKTQLEEIGKTRTEYEQIAEDFSKKLSKEFS